MNPLDNMPEARKFLYLVQWLYNGVLVVSGGVWVIQQRAPENLPEWYIYLAGLGPIVWTYLGFTAQQNVTGKDPEGKNLGEQ